MLCVENLMFLEQVELLAKIDPETAPAERESLCRAIFKAFLSPRPEMEINVSGAAKTCTTERILTKNFVAPFTEAIGDVLRNLQDHLVGFTERYGHEILADDDILALLRERRANNERSAMTRSAEFAKV
jgi:hypothetical protein